MSSNLNQSCFRPELDLFSMRPFQTEIMKTEMIELKPINTLNNASFIEFISFGFFDSYRDCFNSYLKLEVMLDDGTGAGLKAIPQEIKVSCVNNLLGSMFSQCNVFLNTKPISAQETNLPLRHYIESKFNFSANEINNKLAGNLFIADTAGQLDMMTKENVGFEERGKFISKLEPFTLVGPISNDLFAQPRFLLSNVDLRVILTLENKDFIMLSTDAADKSFLRITDASLFIPHITVSPDILLAHERILASRNCVYNIKKIDVRTFTVSPNSTTFTLDNIVIGELPSLLIFGFVDTASLNGNRTKNPFNFKHYNIQSFNLSVNGFQFLPKPLEFNFKPKLTTDKTLHSANEAAHAYFRLHRELQFHMVDRGCNISAEEIVNGSFLLPFDLTPDKTNDMFCTNPPVNGSLKIECRFAQAITDSISVVMYSQTDSELQIDQARNVYLKP